MLKTHMAACLLASALVAAPALAQSTTAPSADRPTATGTGATTSGSPAMQPGGTAGGAGMTGGTSGGSNMTGAGAGPTTSGGTSTGSGAASGTGMGSGTAGSTAASGMAAGGGAGSMKPLATPQPGQVLASDLRGTRVYGSNNESIGDISDLLLDRQGQIVAAIIGVGGFLGIGQKDVAVPFQALEIVPEGQAAGSGAGSGGPATTGTAGTAGSGSGTMNPERIVLRNMTRAELEAAPSFRADGQASSGGSGSGSGSAPRQ